MTTAEDLVLDLDTTFSLEDFLSVSHGQKRRVSLAPAADEILARRRAEMLDHLAQTGGTAYGINTGFGANVDRAVSREGLRVLQRNIVLSHAIGVGEPMAEETVRLAMLLRARSLARGHSGVRPIVVNTLLAFLNAGITPVVPSVGSVSASGDLAPLAHVALGLIGEGRVHYRGEIMPAKIALAREGIAPLVLEEKEGLALTNGSQFANALLIAALPRVENILEHELLATALTAQVMLGADTPFDAELHGLRPHPSAQVVGQKIWDLMQDSPIREAHRNIDVDGEVQDPYNLRGASQILGPLHEILLRVREVATIEANSVTDNPVVLPDAQGKFTRVVSGGHFHGAPLAYELFNLSAVLAKISDFVHTRCRRYVDGGKNKGLGGHAQWPGVTDDAAALEKQASESGMMIVEYTAAGIANQVGALCAPSHLRSLPTAGGQEDDVSMAVNVGLRLHQALPLTELSEAILLAFSSQAAAIRKDMAFIPSKRVTPGGQTTPHRYYWTPDQRRLNSKGEAVLEEIMKIFPVVKEDRYMAEELQDLGRLVASGALVRLARETQNAPIAKLAIAFMPAVKPEGPLPP